MKYKNNPFNIRYTGQQWLGLVGHKNGFCEFETVDYGIRAVLVLMRTYRKYQVNSIYRIINRFAPSSENKTSSYVKFVSENVNINPFLRLSKDFQYYKVLSFMSLFETNTRLCLLDIISVADKFNIRIVS